MPVVHGWSPSQVLLYFSQKTLWETSRYKSCRVYLHLPLSPSVGLLQHLGTSDRTFNWLPILSFPFPCHWAQRHFCYCRATWRLVSDTLSSYLKASSDHTAEATMKRNTMGTFMESACSPCGLTILT